ncbi:MAG: (Fe-S)-binding protein [Syntrophaceae bacterium]|nr:(Fe-S)-binding protein [Syntrophaceae bacterium]
MKWNIPSLKELEDVLWRCTACGTCKEAYEYGPPSVSSPICPAGEEFSFEGFLSSRGKIAFARGILSGDLKWNDALIDAIYKCNVCGGCQSQCELDHKPFIPEIIEAMRRKIVADGVGPMPKQKVIAQSLSSYDNPYQGPRRVRLDWTRPFKKQGKPIKNILEEPASILYYVGCTGGYNVPVRVVPQATASIFHKLGLDFGILGESEICCGSTAMRLGDVEAFKRVAESNLELFRKLHDEKGLKTIVTSCAGCYRAFMKDYPMAEEYGRMMEGIRVIHTSQFLYDLYMTGQLKFAESLPWKVTYHDPCHAGRHLTKFIIDKEGTQLWAGAYVKLEDKDCLYDIPRQLLKAIPGIDLREMRRIKANSYCCGGGGGVMTGYNDWAARNAGIRIQEGMETGADHMVSICPFCHYNLNQGAQGTGSKMKLFDLTELIDKVLPEKAS